jgi:hypothetical protein
MSRVAASLEAPPVQRRVGRWITIVLLLAIGGALVWRGFAFYRLPLAERVGHPDYRALNPAGLIGHGYGIVGTALILSNLLYLVRRRLAKHLPDSIGSMRAWLNGHAFTGLTGSLLVVFHSAFQLRTPIATVTSLSLAIVVVTGLVGFYIHALVPRAGLQPFHDRLEEIRPLLPGLVERVDGYVRSAPVTALPHDASFLRTLFTIPRWLLEARARRRGLKRAAREDKLFRVLEHNDRSLARAFVAELGELASREVDMEAAAAMMRSWRSLHRFLAILMITSVTVHIGVAWFYGFRWIFEK